MTAVEIKIAIAHTLGLVNPQPGAFGDVWAQYRGEPDRVEVPDWPNDLNAMAKLEAALTQDEKLEYIDYLETEPGYFDFNICFASALRRAEAYLKVKGVK